MSRTFSAALAALSITAPAAAAEEVVGRWCDTAWPDGGADTVITRTAGGAHELIVRFAGGSERRKALRLHEGFYYAVGDRFGAVYQVDAAGRLALFDREGFIRYARSGRCER